MFNLIKGVVACIVGAIFFLAIGTAVGLVPQGVWLLWMPFQVHQETRIIRNSNGYITSQQEMLRTLRSDYDGASLGQQAAIRRQMNEIADLIPNDLQPDIRAFLGR